jgi:hypothetical protein
VALAVEKTARRQMVKNAEQRLIRSFWRRHDLFDDGVLITPQSGRERKTSLERGSLMAQGRERTKEQLYREAKRLGVKGRSKMNKGQLKAAVERRR